MKRIFMFAIGRALSLGMPQAKAQQSSPAAEKTKIELKHGSHREGKRTDPVMAKWRGYSLGQFIHWGLYAIPGQWNGKQYNGAAEWIRSWSEKGGAPAGW